MLGCSGVMLGFYSASSPTSFSFLPFRPDMLSSSEVEIWDTCPVHTHSSWCCWPSGKGLWERPGIVLSSEHTNIHYSVTVLASLNSKSTLTSYLPEACSWIPKLSVSVSYSGYLRSDVG